MLGFIPMNKSLIIYRQSSEIDAWGQPTWTPVYKGKCHVTANTDFKSISELDGYQTSLDIDVYLHGLVKVQNGDKLEYTTAGGMKFVAIIKDLSYFEDYGGKVVLTRVVCGKGKRN